MKTWHASCREQDSGAPLYAGFHICDGPRRDLISRFPRPLADVARAVPESVLAAERFAGVLCAHRATRYDGVSGRGFLHGRAELIDRLTTPQGGVVVELGGGDGVPTSIDSGRRMQRLERYTLVDLCPALLEQGALPAPRVHRNVELVEGERDEIPTCGAGRLRVLVLRAHHDR